MSAAQVQSGPLRPAAGSPNAKALAIKDGDRWIS